MHRITSIPDRADMSVLPPMPEESVGRDLVDTYEQIAQRVRRVYDVLAISCK